MRNRDYKFVFMSLCILHLSTLCEGRPMRKRTVSEVQLMHNVGEHKQVQERQEWLQMRLRDIHTAAARGSSREVGRTRRRLRPEDLPDLTPEEIQYALDFLEKLLKSKQS
ncbi:parathyroid hormone [Seriola lalandi dorsalis]|uniref:parathyroid hormone n=1 Tax=Seriola dumerili TaxID=41447 RepID=UPI000BBF1D80|nr:parathyroid hormone [Seriola dumerili]XP_023267160.1 parathyroid hormone [Seriola lalandi dorsalis]